MSIHTSARDYALLDEIAEYFDLLASDCEAMVQRRYSKRDNAIRAQVWREAASDVRSILIDGIDRPKPEGGAA